MMNYLTEFNNKLAEIIARITSWRIWMNIVVFGTVAWLLVDMVTHDKFDPQKVVLVMILTIQTSIDSQGQRISAADARRAEEKRDEQFGHQLSAIADLTSAIREELDQAKERDASTVTRDADTLERDVALRNLFVRLLDTIEDHELSPRGGDLDEPRCVA